MQGHIRGIHQIGCRQGRSCQGQPGYPAQFAACLGDNVDVVVSAGGQVS